MSNLIKHKGNVNGRRKNALAYLEKSLEAWKKHSNPKIKNGVEIRSHEAEEKRILFEIERIKLHLNSQF